jgi:hypothetical protein
VIFVKKKNYHHDFMSGLGTVGIRLCYDYS